MASIGEYCPTLLQIMQTRAIIPETVLPKANPYVQQKQKQNRNSFLILLKKGWNCPCHITKTKAKWLWRCVWFVQSNHSVGMTIKKDFIVLRRIGLVWRSSMTVLRWRREIGCSHPIKTLFGESFSKWYWFCFRKIGISPYKTGGAVSSAEVSDRTENSVTWVLLGNPTSHSLFCFHFCCT